MTSRLRAFVRRDALELATYKSHLLTRGLSVLGLLFSAWFVARTFAGHEPPEIVALGGYFAFLVFGLVVVDVAWALMAGPADRIRQAQLAGTLEAVAAAGVHGVRLFAFEGASVLVGTLVRTTVYLGGAALLLDLPLHIVDPLALILAVALSFGAMAPVGLIGGAITLVLKRTDPVGRGLHALAMLVSGVAYPTSVLPGWLEGVAEVLPTTHALRALRGAFLGGAGSAELAGPLLALAGFAGGGALVAAFVCRAADRLARRRGSLGHY